MQKNPKVFIKLIKNNLDTEIYTSDKINSLKKKIHFTTNMF